MKNDFQWPLILYILRLPFPGNYLFKLLLVLNWFLWLLKNNPNEEFSILDLFSRTFNFVLSRTERRHYPAQSQWLSKKSPLNTSFVQSSLLCSGKEHSVAYFFYITFFKHLIGKEEGNVLQAFIHFGTVISSSLEVLKAVTRIVNLDRNKWDMKGFSCDIR